MTSKVLIFSEKVENWLKPFCKKIKIAGSIRRGVKNPFDIDVVLIPKDESKIINFLKKKGKFLQGGDKRVSFKIEGTKVELYFTTLEGWGATLLAYSSETGAAIGLRVIAKKKGLHLNQYGLFKQGKYLAGKTEKDIYKALGRQYKSPRLR
jgi:DNA polymerase (family X)